MLTCTFELHCAVLSAAAGAFTFKSEFRTYCIPANRNLGHNSLQTSKSANVQLDGEGVNVILRNFKEYHIYISFFFWGKAVWHKLLSQ